MTHIGEKFAFHAVGFFGGIPRLCKYRFIFPQLALSFMAALLVNEQCAERSREVAYLIVAIFSVMLGYEAYADREWRAVAASAAIFVLMCFVIWMLVFR